MSRPRHHSLLNFYYGTSKRQCHRARGLDPGRNSATNTASYRMMTALPLQPFPRPPQPNLTCNRGCAPTGQHRRKRAKPMGRSATKATWSGFLFASTPATAHAAHVPWCARLPFAS
jgi:hypothetical protein